MSNYSKNVVFAIVIIVFLLPKTPYSTSLDTGPLDDYTNPLNLSLKINFQFWGYSTHKDTLVNVIKSLMPGLYVHQTVSPKNSTPTQYKAVIANALYGFQSRMQYSFRSSSQNNMVGLLEKLNDQGAILSTNAIYEDSNNTIQTINGQSIDYTSLAELLSEYNSKNEYTIHILNFASLNIGDTNDSHWFNLGQSGKEFQSVTDMRNLGISGNNSLFYDPTAFAPRFEEGFLDMNLNSSLEIAEYIASRLIKIVEQIIIGSPYSINYLAMENSIHVAQILIGTNITDRLFRNADLNLRQNPVGESALAFAVSNLLPYFNVKISTLEVILDDQKEIASYLTSKEEIVNGTPIIRVNSSFAESMKYLIRKQKNLYSDYPTGYYYAILIMADSLEREYIYEADEGNKTYEVGEIGFGILNLKDWNLLSSNDRLRNKVITSVLKIFGKMIGIAELDGNLVKQINSPMSSYGVTSQWGYSYTNFEIDSIARRFSALYNYTTISNINFFRENLRNSFFSWMDRSALDKAETILIKANTQYYKGEYINAARLYLQAFQRWQDAEKDINQSIIAFYNTINLIGIFIILGIIIVFMRSLTITKEEFIDNIRKFRKNN